MQEDNRMRLKDKVAIITGAASGIGRASAVIFAKEGASVIVSDIDDVGGQGTVNQIVSDGGRAIYVHADVSKEAQVQHLVETTVGEFGRVNVLFNNAGYYKWPYKLEEITEEEWDKTYAINVKSILWGAKHVVPKMKKIGGGAIINTASMAGVRPRKGLAYGSAKAAAIALTRILAAHLASDNIRVNVINPVATETPLLKKFLGVEEEAQMEAARKERVKTIPLGRTAKPEEIAYAAVYLASDEALMLTGVSINVDGGSGL
jgi:3-oxoacyl-[acyl-carrier protein] reductase